MEEKPYKYKHVLRVIEKLPGVNFLQVAEFGSERILMFPKIGTRSIRNALLEYHDLKRDKREAWRSISYSTRKYFRTTLNTPHTWVILRDPLERLHSCWKQKISDERDSGMFYFAQYYPLLQPSMSFLDFLKAICRLPLWAQEKHFIPLGYFLRDLPNLRYRFIGLPDLDWKLRSLLETNSRPERSNVTKPSSIPQEAHEFFAQRLSMRYQIDISLLSQLNAIGEK